MASQSPDGAVGRREDPPLLTGAALYTDDLAQPEALHAVFVRAPLAHGRILAVDPAAAVAMPGVAGVFSAADLVLPPMPARGAPAAMARPVLAIDTVRFLGEPVAVVVADSRANALDAAEAVEVDYQPLPVVTDPEAALAADAPRLFPEGNLAKERRWPDPSRALEGAEVVVRARFVNQRVTAAPLSPTPPSPSPSPSATASPCTPPARRRSGCATRWPRRWGWSPNGCGRSSRRSAAPSGQDHHLPRAGGGGRAGQAAGCPGVLHRRPLGDHAGHDPRPGPGPGGGAGRDQGRPHHRAAGAAGRRRLPGRGRVHGVLDPADGLGRLPYPPDRGGLGVRRHQHHPGGRLPGGRPARGHRHGRTLGVEADTVTVVHSDTAALPRGDGMMGSRSLQVGGSAVLRAAEQVLDKATALAAHLLEAPATDVAVFAGEGLGVAGAPAVQNAVVDALAHLGVVHIDMPLTPERVWRAIQDA